MDLQDLLNYQRKAKPFELSASDTQKKLQKVEGAYGIPTSQLIEITFKVFNNQDQVSKKEKKQEMKLHA